MLILYFHFLWAESIENISEKFGTLLTHHVTHHWELHNYGSSFKLNGSFPPQIIYHIIATFFLMYAKCDHRVVQISNCHEVAVWSQLVHTLWFLCNHKVQEMCFKTYLEEKLPRSPKLWPIYRGDLAPSRYFQVIFLINKRSFIGEIPLGNEVVEVNHQ